MRSSISLNVALETMKAAAEEGHLHNENAVGGRAQGAGSTGGRFPQNWGACPPPGACTSARACCPQPRAANLARPARAWNGPARSLPAPRSWPCRRLVPHATPVVPPPDA